MFYHANVDVLIKSLVFLAREGKPVIARKIAQEVGSGGPWVAKVLQEAARRKLLRSEKGATGGFELAVDARDITLAGLLDDYTESHQFSEWCGPRAAKAARRYQEVTTIADLAKRREAA